jgi:hypothetical protein
MKQTAEERDEIIARAVAQARQNIIEMNAGPMKHTLRKRARLEKKLSKRR